MRYVPIKNNHNFDISKGLYYISGYIPSERSEAPLSLGIRKSTAQSLPRRRHADAIRLFYRQLVPVRRQ